MFHFNRKSQLSIVQGGREKFSFVSVRQELVSKNYNQKNFFYVTHTVIDWEILHKASFMNDDLGKVS